MAAHRLMGVAATLFPLRRLLGVAEFFLRTAVVLFACPLALSTTRLRSPQNCSCSKSCRNMVVILSSTLELQGGLSVS